MRKALAMVSSEDGATPALFPPNCHALRASNCRVGLACYHSLAPKWRSFFSHEGGASFDRQTCSRPSSR
jgi:hypothetical protein